MSAVQSKMTCVWRLVDGKTQVIAYTLSGVAASTAVGAQTNAVRLSCITGNCLVRINQGTAASASQGALLKPTDPATVFLCGGGDKVEVFGIAAGTLYMDELSG